jgi:hypothetical protein
MSKPKNIICALKGELNITDINISSQLNASTSRLPFGIAKLTLNFHDSKDENIMKVTVVANSLEE